MDHRDSHWNNGAVIIIYFFGFRLQIFPKRLGFTNRLHVHTPLAHALENYAKSADPNVHYCESFNRSVVKLLQFYLQKGGAKKHCCA